mgnify:CR=1 FL=1
MEKKENNKLFINIHKDLSISIRTSNILKNQGIIFIKDLIQYNEKQILSFPGAGKGMVKEIQDILGDLAVTSFTEEISLSTTLSQLLTAVPATMAVPC